MIKAIAVDMDGTFLRSDHSYDEERFDKIYKELVARDIKFIVASGSQYYRLKELFPSKDDEITYASENGAVVTHNDEVLDVTSFDKDFFRELIDYLTEYGDEMVLCGVKNAYTLDSVSEEYKEVVKQYYFKYDVIDSFDDLPDDDFVKIAFNAGVEAAPRVVKELLEKFPNKLYAASSGFKAVDILNPKAGKGIAVKNLLKKWDIKPNELLTFGDADNDVEMLSLTDHSYAMAKSSKKVQETAKHMAPSNEDSGVLTIIEQYLDSL
ncbi:MAG: Cof-type HAD-IIB family hydrolase [Micrococcaceae bacterium]